MDVIDWTVIVVTVLALTVTGIVAVICIDRDGKLW
jgi:hypothetical protein